MKKNVILLFSIMFLFIACNNGIKVGKNEILIRNGRDSWEYGFGGNKKHTEYIVKDNKTGEIKGKLLVNNDTEKVYFIHKDKYTILGKRPLTEEEKKEKEKKEKEIKKAIKKYEDFFSLRPKKRSNK